MKAYIYCGDLYCEECGKAIRRRIKAEGFAPSDPDDETTYDSDEYPKGPYEGGESDSPGHCAEGEGCLNVLEIEGHRYGAFLENPLTSHGEGYVKGLHKNDPSPLTQMWMDHYGLEEYGDNDEAERECPVCGADRSYDCQGEWRCEECDDPCPGCYGGPGPGYEDDPSVNEGYLDAPGNDGGIDPDEYPDGFPD